MIHGANLINTLCKQEILNFGQLTLTAKGLVTKKIPINSLSSTVKKTTDSV
jgi:hypothetical protein